MPSELLRPNSGLTLMQRPENVPWVYFREVALADRASREYVLAHPYFSVELRCRKADRAEFGGADYQLRFMGGSWPRIWIETRDLAGDVHMLGFDKPMPHEVEAQHRLTTDALRVFWDRLIRPLCRLNLCDEGEPMQPRIRW